MQATQKAEAAARRERVLERLQSVVPDMLKKTVAWMKEYGHLFGVDASKLPESDQKRLVDRGYIELPEKPEKPTEPPLTALERDFQQRQQQQRDDRDDEHQGPGSG